jgi:hypothetical protein
MPKNSVFKADNWPISKSELVNKISGSWLRASAMKTMNKNQPDAQ